MSLLPNRPPAGLGRSPPPSPGRPILGRDVALTLAVLIGAYLFAVLAFGLLFGAGPPADAAAARLRVMAGLAVGFFVLFGAPYAVMIRVKGYSWADLGIRPLAPHWLRMAVVLGIVMLPIALLIGSTVQRYTGAAPQELTRVLSESGFTILSAVTLFLYIAVLQPIAEELVFRGMLFGWLRQWQNFAVTNVLCAAAFALVHVQMIAVVVSFLLGLLLGWLRERSGSVLAPILMHQVYNGVVLVLTFGATLIGAQAD
jgi:hypothetical protein